MNSATASWDSHSRWPEPATATTTLYDQALHQQHQQHRHLQQMQQQQPQQQQQHQQRHVQHQHQHHQQHQYHASSPPFHVHSSRPSGSHQSAPDRESSAMLDHSTSHHSSIGQACQVAADPLPRLTEPYAVTTSSPVTNTTNHTRYHYNRRHHSPTQSTSPRETSTGPWRGLHNAHDHPSSSQLAAHHGPPLSLDIPQQDLPSISPIASSLLSGSQTTSSLNSKSTYPSSTTSLPSFAAFQEQTSSRNDDVDGPEIAPMSSRLTCQSCSKLQPWVRDVAVAVAELDETVQTHCFKSITRSLDIPNESLIGLVQWIVDRLRTAKADVQDASRRAQTDYSPPQSSRQAIQNGHLQRPPSPSNALKRNGERWERDELPAPKRPRSGASVEQSMHLPALTPRDERRGSVEFAERDSRYGYSPSQNESSHPQHTSPSFANHSLNRSLPSPSSLAYPPSAAPSLPPPTVGSPATSYQAATIHSTSNSSATSAHIADLQHQVTLKSLALQTLQSEYASLLQKLQRERVKSQTIEKKTSVADQEVNDLTSKNEDMTEQIKILESQLEDSEKKREAEKAEAAKEKEQWGRMLEMGGRLQAKIDSDRQRLVEEKEQLVQRLAEAKAQAMSTTDQAAKDLKVQRPTSDRTEVMAHQASHPATAPAGTSVGRLSGEKDNGEAVILKHEIEILSSRIEALRQALQEVRQHHRQAQEQARAFFDQNNQLESAIDSALSSDASKAGTQRNETELQKAPSPHSTPVPHKTSWSPPTLTHPAGGLLQSNAQPSRSTTAAKHGTLEVMDGGKSSIANIAEVARARTPGPDFHIAPSTSSPEELIKALGPVPGPYRNTQFSAYNAWEPTPKGTRHPGTSPRSYHSSPGEVLDDGSNGTASAGRSPEGYNSEPDLPNSRWSSTDPRSHPTLPPIHTSASNVQPTSSPYPQSGYKSWDMPPPPRREAGTSAYRG